MLWPLLHVVGSCLRCFKHPRCILELLSVVTPPCFDVAIGFRGLFVKVAEIEEAEKDKMRKKCKKIIEHGINVFINRQLIYNFPEQVGLGSCTRWQFLC